MIGAEDYTKRFGQWLSFTPEEKARMIDIIDAPVDEYDAAFLIDIGMDILQDVTDDFLEGHLMDISEYTEKAVDYLATIYYNGHKIWSEFVKQVNDQYQQDIVKFGFFITADIMIDSMDKNYVNAIRVMRDALSKATMQAGDDLFDEISPLTEISDEEIEQVTSENPNLMYAFFNTFKEIGSYHRNINEYTDPKQIELHKKLTAIYHIMTKS